MDLSKAFDIPNRNLLLARRNACSSSFNATNGFFNEICYFIQEAYIFNTANYNSLYSIDGNFKENKTILKKNFKYLYVWFSENYMVLNRENHLIINKEISKESIEFGNKT